MYFKCILNICLKQPPFHHELLFFIFFLFLLGVFCFGIFCQPPPRSSELAPSSRPPCRWWQTSAESRGEVTGSLLAAYGRVSFQENSSQMRPHVCARSRAAHKGTRLEAIWLKVRLKRAGALWCHFSSSLGVISVLGKRRNLPYEDFVM